MENFDFKDWKILYLLDTFGPNISARKISNILGIPDRTIRHRIQKMRESSRLKTHVYTHERDLGLDEFIIMIEENPSFGKKILNYLSKNSHCYWIGSCIGKYNGFLIHVVIPHNAEPKLILEQIKSDLEDNGWIRCWKCYSMNNYIYKNTDFPSDVVKEFNKNTKKEIDSNAIMTKIFSDKRPQRILVDSIDLMILEQMRNHGLVSPMTLNKVIPLSVSQIRNRISGLEKNGIIKGVVPIFSFIPKDELIYVYLYLELDSNNFNYISDLFKQIHLYPFRFMFIACGNNCFIFRSNLNPQKMTVLMQLIENIKKYVSNYYIQLIFTPPYIFPQKMTTQLKSILK